MKKLISLIIVLLILFSIPLASLSADPSDPKTPNIEQISPVFAARKSVAKLSIKATVSDGGTLTYLWYETHDGTLPSIIAMIGEEAPDFICDTTTPGTRYYVCMVSNNKDGKTTRAYSDVISVTVYNPVPIVSYNATNIELDQMQSYILEASVQLPQKDIGTLSYQWYSNSTNLIGTAEPMAGATDSSLALSGSSNAGTQYFFCVVKNMYLGETYSSFSSEMTIAKVVHTGNEHVHAFSEWMVTAEPTCDEPGIKLRECECGVTERDEILALGHDFGDWMIDSNDPLTEIRVCKNEGCNETEKRSILFPETDDGEQALPTLDTESNGQDTLSRTLLWLWVTLGAIACGVLVVSVTILIARRKRKGRSGKSA